MTCKLQSAFVERSVCPIGFKWRLRDRLFNKHDKALGVREGDAYSAEFVRHGILGRDVTYCGTDLPTFRTNLLVSSSVVEICRPLFTFCFLHYRP